MNESPWSAYGRGDENRSDSAASGRPDPTLGAARELMLTQAQLKRYLARALREYNEIRAGRTGYTSIIAEALKPSPRPETIEERLRRLADARANTARPRDDPPSAA